MKIEINIKPKTLEWLKRITANGLNGTINSQINKAIEYYLVNYLQLIPAILCHKSLIDKEELKELFIDK